MNQVVTFTGLETKTGANDNGGWTLYLFKDAGGNKFQTFDDDLGSAGQKLVGQSIEVEYETEERNLPAKGDRPATTVTNRVLKSVRGSTGVVGVQPQETVNAGSSFGSDRPIRSHETNRSDALGHAVAKIGPDSADPERLFTLADVFVRYIETGSAVEPEGSEDSVKF